MLPRSNDGAQRLYYYMCELRRQGHCAGPRPLIYDLARIEREASRTHTLAATTTLAAGVGASVEALPAARARLEQRLSLSRTIREARDADACVAGSEALALARALHVDWSGEFDAHVRDGLASLVRRTPRARLVLAGSTPTDERIYREVEANGGNVVDELFDEAPAQSVARWSRSTPAWDGIAAAYGTAMTAATLLRKTPDVLIERARAARAQAVILWLIEEDEGIVWELPRQVARLEAAGLAVLTLTRQTSQPDHTTRAVIGDFTRGL